MPALPKNSPILFISPDQSFFAELNTEGKTPELKNVTEIDASLIEDNQVQSEALEAALSSLETKSIYLVLSDEIFLHYIGDFPVNDKLSLEEHISNTIGKAFPDQKDPLHIVTLDLAKTSRIQTIQITAMTKENLQRISDALHAAGVTLKKMIPASFVVKAFVSIDPSLFILESPDSYLLTSHYIGVEHAEKIDKTDISNLTSQLEKLKESHPHLQHVYLSLIDEKDESIKEAVEAVMPTQPVELPKVKAESDTPHILKAIVLGFREVVENKFPFPEFELPESTAKPSTKTAAEKEEVEEIPSVLEDEQSDEKEEKASATLPTPALKKAEIKEEKAEISKPEKEEEPEEKEEEKEKDEEKDEEEVTEKDESDKKDDKTVEPKKVDKPTGVIKSGVAAASIPSTPGVIKPVVTPPSVGASTSSAANKEATSPTVTPGVVKPATPTVSTDATKQATIPSATKATVKTKRNVFSYIVLGTVIALVIALIGGGVVISQQALQNNGQVAQNPDPVVESTPEPTPSPTPTPIPEPIAKDEVNILVVNATSKAGYAGVTSGKLEDAGYTEVSAANARGEYEEAGTYVMVKDDEEMPGIVEQLEEDADLELEKIDFDKSEDPNNRYDVIIVLNE